MLKVDPSLNHVPAKREHVVALLESINQPLVNIPSHGTASTGAFILGTRNEHGYYTVFVYLHQPETKAVVIYVSEPRNLTGEQYQGEQDEALRFVESMGFMIDDIKFPTLSQSEQESVVSRVPLFRPPERTVDLYDVADSLSVEESTEPSMGQRAKPPPPPGPEAPFTPVGGGPPISNAPSSGAMSIPGTPTSGLNVPMGGGYPPTVQGMPASSAGASAYPGSGYPQSGSGYPQSGSGYPQSGSGYPQSSSGYPQSNPGQARAGPNGQEVEALKRIARLLSSFVWLLAAGWVVAACQTARPADQRAVDSQVDLGTQHLARGSWADAVRAYQQALQMDPKSQDAARGLGVAYLKLERWDKAEEYLRQAVKLAPDWSMPKNELAVVLIEQERCGEAIEVLDQVLEDIFYGTPEYAEHNRARALHCAGRTPEAVAQLEELLRKKPKFCLGYLTLSEMAFETQKHEATIQACDGFVRHCEKDEEIQGKILPQYSAMCYYRKGVAYAALGDVESARASFLRCEATGALEEDCRTHLNSLPP